MRNFPLETLSATMSHLPKTDLKKARFVCKAFDAEAVPFLFKDIYLIARYADMEKATLLASRFGSYVKTMILSSEWFDDRMTWERFKRRVGNVKLAKSYYDSYRRLEFEREELLTGGEFFYHLCNTLAILPLLHKVILTDGERTEDLCWCQQAYVDGHSRAFDPFSDEDYPELKNLRPPPEHHCVKASSGLGQMECNVWSQLFRALYTTGHTKVKTIVTEVCGSGLTVSAFFKSPRQTYCTTNVLPILTSLHLHLDFHTYYYNEDDESFLEPVIAQTLSAAINLESLMIELMDTGFDDEQEDQGITTFELVLEGCKMPRLRTFGLTDFSVPEDGMTDFLQHSQGIRHLSLDDVRLTSGSWEDMFKTIKDNLSLETFEFDNLQGGVAELTEAGFICEEYQPYPAIKEFLLGDGPNPFSVEALEYAASKGN